MEELRPPPSPGTQSRRLVTKEFKSGFIGEGAVRSAPSVAFPTIGDAGKSIVPGQTMHCTQLDDVQPVIKRTGNHWQSSARLFVKGPESEIVALKIVEKGANSAGEEILRGGLLGRKKVIVDSPKRPDE